jgi:hypothetical protein
LQETVEQEEEKGKLADFMKAIHTLGSREDIEPPNEIGEDKESVNMAEQEPTLQSGAPSVGEVPTSFWHQVMDSNSNHPYYWNPVTNEVSWTLPDGGVISYGGTPGGDEKGEPLDYFAYYDEGVVVPDRRGKGRGEAVGTTESTKKGTGGGVGDGEKEAENKNVDIASEGNELNLEVGEQSGGGGGGTKRKLDLEEAEEGEFQLMPTSTATQSPDGVSPPKKIPRGPLPRSVVWGVPDDKPKKQRSSPIISSVRQEQQAMRFQVSSLADELSRKLQFLHVSSDGVSDMQILQVEVKTRLSDWEEGGLETKFLLSKLKEASDSLLNYEKEAAPKGWRFLWDSLDWSGELPYLHMSAMWWIIGMIDLIRHEHNLSLPIPTSVHR